MKRRILLSFLAILLISVTIIGLLSINLVKNSYSEELEHRLMTNAGLIATFISSEGTTPEDSGFIPLIDEMAVIAQSRITVMNLQGRILYDTWADATAMELHDQRPEIRGAIEEGMGREVRFSSTIGKEMMYVAVPVVMEGQNVFVVRLSMELTELDLLTRQIVVYLTFSILVGLLIAMVLGFRLVDRMIENIRGIVRMTQRMAEGAYDQRIYLDSDDELAELASHFNHMADQLKETIGQLAGSNARLNALLTSLRNPIIAVDPRQRIRLMNAAAEKLFQVSASDMLGKHLLELIRHTALDDAIGEAIAKQQERQMEVAIREPEEKILRIVTSVIQDEFNPIKPLGLVILIDDVTEIRKLEKVRSDFVTNVTHELKTPLTSISGFVETLKSGEIEDEATRQRFLDIIEIETDRLTRLINDILTLSEIENIQGREAARQVPPRELIQEVVDMMTSVSWQKQVTLLGDIDRNLPDMWVNEDRFKQMLINVIDNAVKFTPEGGRVEVKAFQAGKNLMIRVRDTGVGIPEEDLPRLFERFYRVEKARTKKSGGTGLGLAIVKHIVRSMNGQIRVNSAPGEGTEFVLTIPIQENKPDAGDG